ncbi:hypothetical protein TRVL_07025 [Trypanosoma vivax]|uniref:Leucine-rich repeat protein (LRRP) n=1 Tax=Trypanosoma vivax (strain Y486) TaxID=1055687 RepID=G0TWD3_TRYVY|nr:hypothetical protein TRVL_07025 [Trypanosoma vivax]CCC48271.1 hypothetical protein, conserved in T. vivax [Trypanosoma vivax Y486]
MTALSMQNCTNITDVFPLQRMSSLRALQIAQCTGIVRGMNAVCKLTTLQELRLWSVPDVLLRYLSSHQHLHELHLVPCACIADVLPLTRSQELDRSGSNDCTNEETSMKVHSFLYSFQCLLNLRKNVLSTKVLKNIRVHGFYFLFSFACICQFFTSFHPPVGVEQACFSF